MPQTFSLQAIRDLAETALIDAGATSGVAETMAQSITDAEADGIRMIGLDYLPVYLRHLKIGKVRGDAIPEVRKAGNCGLVVDARFGFCHAAFVAAEEEFYALARANSLAGLGLRNSYASGVLGWFCERMARAGLVGLTFSNASPTMAPHGGSLPVFGTNPLALGVPRAGRPPLIIDLSPAATTRLEIKRRRAAGEEIPSGWGLDGTGRPCSDPAVVLDEGTVAPANGHKGSALALIVEILAAGLTGSNWSFEASDLGTDDGGPPGIGQFFIAIDPESFGGSGFASKIESLIACMLEQDGVRLPGDRRISHRARAERNGIEVGDDLLDTIQSYIQPA